MSTLTEPRRSSPRSRAGRVLTALAGLAAGSFCLALGVRPLASPDLGYHLAYGEAFLDRGHIVDGSDGIYTMAREDGAPAEAPWGLAPPGPGCWRDGAGRYRFPNANWLSQVVMAAVHRAGGVSGLCGLQAALSAGVFGLVLVALRRLGVGWPSAAAALLLAGLTAYERLSLRPEVFGYLVLAAQACLLTGRADEAVGAGRMAALVALQLLLVNLHSYFLLGLALTGASAADVTARWLWSRRAGAGDDRRRAAGRSARRLAALLAAQAAVCFANPWTWRLAALPVQTVLFLQANQIAASAAEAGAHPWSLIGEFYRTLGPAPESYVWVKARAATVALLALAGAGGAAALARRRWAWAMVIAGMAAVALAMRRNIAPAAVLIVPLAVAALAGALGPLGARIAAPARRLAGAAGVGGVALAGAALTLWVISDGFYSSERSANRFGVGLSRLMLPVGPCEWISRHRPAGAVWTDYDSSSNVHCFTQPRRAVPILTNTWAYPPALMQRVIDISRDPNLLEPTADRFGVEVVALRVTTASAPLVHGLAQSDRWALVHLEAAYAVFLRRGGPNEELAAAHAIDPAAFDASRFAQQVRRADPVPAQALYAAGNTLFVLGWDDAAVAVLREALAARPRYAEAWMRLGICLARRGQGELVAMIDHRQAGRHGLADDLEKRGRDDWRDAEDCFRRASRIAPGHPEPAVALRNIRQQRQALLQGQVIQMRYPL